MPGFAEHLGEQFTGPIDDLRLAGERRVAGHESHDLDHAFHPGQLAHLGFDGGDRVQRAHRGQLLGLLRVDVGTGYSALVAQLVALGAGIGLVVPVMTSTLLGSADASRAGVASGTLNTARQTGSVLGVALFGAVTAGGAQLIAGLHLALLICIGLAAGVVALTRRMDRSAP